MSKKYMYLFGAALLALSGIGATAQSAQAKSAHHYRTNVTRNVNNKYFVNAPQSISSNARVITGTANKGARVTLQSGKRVIARTYANKNGRYTLRIPKRFIKAGNHLTVMAQKGYWHPYKVVFVKTPANQKAAVRSNKKTNRKVVRKSTKKSAKTPVKKASLEAQVEHYKNLMSNLKAKNSKEVKEYNTYKKQVYQLQNMINVKQSTLTKRNAQILAKMANLKSEYNTLASQLKISNKSATKSARKAPAKKVNKVNRSRKPSRKANKVTVKTPNGNWQTRTSKRYAQRWNLSQKRGLNESLYKNNRYVKKLITNAPYSVKSVKNNVWTINYQARNQKPQTMTLKFVTNNNFKLTSQNGHKANLNFLRY